MLFCLLSCCILLSSCDKNCDVVEQPSSTTKSSDVKENYSSQSNTNTKEKKRALFDDVLGDENYKTKFYENKKYINYFSFIYPQDWDIVEGEWVEESPDFEVKLYPINNDKNQYIRIGTSVGMGGGVFMQENLSDFIFTDSGVPVDYEYRFKDDMIIANFKLYHSLTDNLGSGGHYLNFELKKDVFEEHKSEIYSLIKSMEISISDNKLVK